MRAGEQATTRPGGKRRQTGFTLIEVMIAVAVVAILAAIAYPSYSRYVERARVTDGQAAVMEIAAQMERCYTVTADYSGCRTSLGYNAAVSSEDGHYNVTVATPNASTFTITANADDANQVACAQLTLDQTGNRGPDNDDCWPS